jgi:DNA-binding NarL/FixJ family response regulator
MPENSRKTDGQPPGRGDAAKYSEIGEMSQKHSIVIAENHQLFREGLKSMLADNEQYDVIAEAEDGLEAIRHIRRNQPDLLLLDLSMPRLSGISVIKDVKSAFPEVKILILTIHESDQ